MRGPIYHKVDGTAALKGGNSALEALVDAAAGILAADSLQGTLGRIAHHLAAVVSYDDLSLYEIDRDELRPVFAVAGNPAPIALAEGVTGWAVRHRRTCNADTVVAVPLVAHDRVLGALNVHRSAARRSRTRRSSSSSASRRWRRSPTTPCASATCCARRPRRTG